MRLGFPTTRRAEGPKIFLNRLRDSIKKQGLAKTSSFIWPLHDISLFTSVARPLYGRPYVLRLDGIYFDEQENSGSNTELNLPIFNSIDKARGIVFQSEFNRTLVTGFYGDITAPSCVIQNGVNLNDFCSNGSNKRGYLGLPYNAVVLMTSASWRSHKRLSSVIDVFLQLSEQNQDIYLVILGGGIPEDKKNIHPRIKFVGHIEPVDLPAWYRSADVFVFLSWLDHCPNTVVEAVASGVPVVCTNQGGTKEIIQRSNGGIVAEADEEYNYELVSLYDPPTPKYGVVIDAINNILKNKKEYQAKIDFEAVNIDKTAEKYIKFIEHCLYSDGPYQDG